MRKFVLASLAAASASTFTMFARAEPAGWAYNDGVKIQEMSGAALTDQQVAITLDTATLIAANKMSATGDDLRFYTDCTYATTVPYWIESGIDTATTKIWLRVPSLAANGTATVYVAYGNPAAAAASNALEVFDGAGGAPGTPISATNQYFNATVGGVNDSQRGFRFAPKRDVLLVQLGKNEPNGTARDVTVFDFATQAILRQGQVTGAAATYSYADTTPLWLTNGTQYVVEIHQGPADGYYYSTSSQIDPNLTYLDMRYCNSCTKDTFPTNALDNHHYGYVDFTFLTKKEVSPAPAQVATGCASTATCDQDCTPASCGDGFVNTLAGEMCDDGNTVDTDACRNDCSPASCGDGVLESGVEQCDDGNAVDTDACRTTCVKAACGDGVVESGVEACDDGNTVDTDACRNDCTAARCGDGVVQKGVEQCDDGNAADGDGCSSTCATEAPPASDAGADAGAPDSGLFDEPIQDPTAGDGGGCACTTAGGRAPWEPALVVAGVAFALARTRRRRRR